jgi:hypothetical protein
MIAACLNTATANSAASMPSGSYSSCWAVVIWWELDANIWALERGYK